MNTITINGKTIKHSAQGDVCIANGKVTIGGVDVSDLDSIEEKQINIVIDGNVGYLSTEDGDITVNGNVKDVTTKNGNVTCGDVDFDVETKNGNVKCGSVTGSVTTKNGNITRR